MKKTAFFTMLFLSCQLTSCFFQENISNKDKKSAENENNSLLLVDETGISTISAVIKTVHGNITIKFYPKDAPVNVERFLELIQNGFYDGLLFHRVEKNFVIQSGDPTNTGNGGSGRKLPAEFNSHIHTLGTVGMARFPNDINSADSQFYISLSESPELDGKYTIIGKVTKGLEILHKINKGDKIISLILLK